MWLGKLWARNPNTTSGEGGREGGGRREEGRGKREEGGEMGGEVRKGGGREESMLVTSTGFTFIVQN